MKQQLKFISLLALLILASNSSALINELIINSFNINVELDSFQGGEYFPENDEMNYQQKTDFRIGTRFNLSDQCDIGLKFRYSHNFFEEMIKLDSLSINLNSENFLFAFRIYDKKYGSKSYLQNLDASTGYYKRGILDYRFVGLAARYNYKLKNNTYLSAYATIGGNEYNRTLSMLDLGFHQNNLDFSVGALYFSRSNRNNQPGYLVYTEFDWSHEWVDMYIVSSYEHFDIMGLAPKMDRVKFYGETIFKPSRYLSFGGGYYYEKEDCDKSQYDQEDNSIYLFAEPKHKRFKNSILLEFMDNNNYDYKKYQNILTYSLTDFWDLGLSVTYIETDPGTENYQFGFQVEMNYDAR